MIRYLHVPTGEIRVAPNGVAPDPRPEYPFVRHVIGENVVIHADNIVPDDTKVIEDPGARGSFVIMWRGALCSPVFNSSGAADACLVMYLRGTRQPEIRR